MRPIMAGASMWSLRGGCGCSTRWLCTCGAEASTGRPWRSTSAALVGRKRVLGDHHPDTLTSLNDLADIRRILGDFQGARQLFEQTSAARRRVLGDNHPETLWSMYNLAETRRALGDLQALTSCTSRPGRTAPSAG